MPRTPNGVTNVRLSADLTTFVRIALIIATLGLDLLKVSYWCSKMSNCSSELYRRHHSELLLCNFDWMRNLLRITLLSRFVHVNWLNWEIWQAVIDKEKIRRMKKLQNLLLGRNNTFQSVLNITWILSTNLWIFQKLKISAKIYNFQGKDVEKRSWWWSKTNWKLPMEVSDARFCILNLSWTYML